MPKATAPSIRSMKGGAPIVCVTAYDAVTGAIAEEAGVDLILVGDSVGNVVLGYETTLPVTLDQMVHHVAAVRRGVRDTFLVADMPFGSYQSSAAQAVDSAVALMRVGAEAVKLEGAYVSQIEAIVAAGIPVMGHVGMTPQSVNAFGGFKMQGKGEAGADVQAAAHAIQEAGAFSIVLELIPSTLAQTITGSLEIPTIGIGAGPHCDGQIQVFHDLVGLSPHVFRHAKRYTNGREAFAAALSGYAAEVRGGAFPSEPTA